MGSKPLSPFIRVSKRVLNKRADYSSSERLVALAVADRFDSTGLCFMGINDIVARTGLGRSTVKNSLRELCNGKNPQFARTLSSFTKGRSHRFCYEYRIVSDPPFYAAGRDAARRAMVGRKDKRAITNGSVLAPKDKRGPARRIGAPNDPQGAIGCPTTGSHVNPKDSPELPHEEDVATRQQSTKRKDDKEHCREQYKKALKELSMKRGHAQRS